MGLRVVVLGGTRFIGRAIVDELVGAGHDVLVVHRGETEPDDLPDVAHLHVDKSALHEVRADLDRFGPDAVLDCYAFGAADADAALAAIPPDDDLRLVVLSSMDVYRAYGSLHAGTVTDAVPLDETSPVRSGDRRYPYRGQIEGMDEYEKLDVEERWLARGATVCRLPMVIGERDYQRRQEFMLRRVRAGRRQVPIGGGTALLTHGYVGDIARGVRLVLEASPGVVSGEVFNFGERRTPTMALRAQQILDAAGASDVVFVRVPDDALPADLNLLGASPQPFLVSSDKARRMLGWEESDPDEALRRTVAWHLDHPPPDEGDDQEADWTADDLALARAISADATA